MGEADVQFYINPLTLEAQMFLDSMEAFGKSFNQIDAGLYNLLEKVVTSIDNFLGQKLVPIMNTETTILIPPQEFRNIRRIYHCDVCKMDLGKSVEKAAVHLTDRHSKKKATNSRKERRKAEQDKRASKIVKLPKKAVSLINSEFLKFFDDNILIAEKLKEIPDYAVIEKELLQTIEPLFPQQPVKLFKFGSRISGIGTRNSDLDIFVDIGKTFNDFENRASSKTLNNLVRVHNALQKNRKDWLHLTSIEKARVPIIRVLHAKTSIECDIGFSNSLGYCNTKLLEYLFELQPIARRMSIFVKKWLERTKLADFSLTTYAMNLMIIYFLQIKNYLPAIQDLQSDIEKCVHVGPWKANFIEKELSSFQMEQVTVDSVTCRTFLKSFFKFYAFFDFDNFVVCPYFGRETDIAKIEEEMPKRYQQYIGSGKLKEDLGLQLSSPMVVQDPIQLNHNVCKSAHPLKTIVSYFKQSFEAFSN